MATDIQVLRTATTTWATWATVTPALAIFYAAFVDVCTSAVTSMRPIAHAAQNATQRKVHQAIATGRWPEPATTPGLVTHTTELGRSSALTDTLDRYAYGAGRWVGPGWPDRFTNVTF